MAHHVDRYPRLGLPVVISESWYKALVTQAPDKARFGEITAQLKTKAIRVKTGTLVDATIIASASEEDGEARWVKHRGWAAVHGFKAHVGDDADTALVEEVAVTPGQCQ